MRISISSLRSEEYDICEKHRRHKENCCGAETCDVTEYLTHKAKYRAARAEYKKDAESNTACPKDIKVSADLQVIMLPRIDEFKTCVFTHRFFAFNETKDSAVLWHEAISSRRDEDIASARPS
ncbi:Cai-1 autoinducer sensor kinase/phosphatase cqss [Plakobranchus ocellatus]|uniref:Cai-1 autoinducer sensor kinase/phosphatase cqss n=1 Tax=Plakobranchus ocellatus TaxID=259542 RepID=A0AAV3XR72_9GAST|nr:Cai-1 autoinducer sensor kinase/phosphatase cqss [Plakobranchus ocellatus]